MSLWTPSGEHPVGGGDRPTRTTPERSTPPEGRDGAESSGPGGAGASAGAEAAQLELDQLRRQLADAPADVVVANHCYGLFELAAVYLSESPPRLEQARLAIDALGFVVDGLGDRLGEPSASLRDALAQIRLAYVQIDAGAGAGTAPGNGSTGGRTKETLAPETPE